MPSAAGTAGEARSSQLQQEVRQGRGAPPILFTSWADGIVLLTKFIAFRAFNIFKYYMQSTAPSELTNTLFREAQPGCSPQLNNW